MTEILIATDKENSLLEMLLSSERYDVVSHTTGRDILEYLKDHTPTLIMLDANLPDLNGANICGRLKKIKRLQGVPIIMLVSARDSQQYLDAQLSNADSIIKKPLMGQDIRATVAQLLGKHTLSDVQAPLRRSA